MITPSIGRTVHFVLPNQQHVPAIITKVIGKGEPTEDSLVNLQVFLDSEKGGVKHAAKVSQAQANKSPGTWHEPERV
jgi:hypothetical protein